MRYCLNCYNSWICKTKTPAKYEKHFKEDTTCSNWEDDSVDWNSQENNR